MSIEITEITVGAGTSFNHPHESYANFKPSVTIKAKVGPGEDGAAVARELQRRAHNLVTEEKERILDEINKDEELDRVRSAIEQHERTLKEFDATLAAGPGERTDYDREYARDSYANVSKYLAECRLKLAVLLGPLGAAEAAARPESPVSVGAPTSIV